MGKVSVRVPATSANLGPGFDALGLALGLYDTFTFEEGGGALRVTGCEAQYANEHNLAVVGFAAAMARMGLPMPRGLSVHIEAEIPVSRGLGSSAALIVGGAAAANALHGGPLDKRALLGVCSALEGHPDNVAPALYGGLTAAILAGSAPIVAQYAVHPSLRFTALVPDFELKTCEARAALPELLPRADAVFTLGRLAVLLKALETGDAEAISAAAHDRLHEPYRTKLIDEYDFVRAAACEEGCAAFVISGSGSTCLAIGGGADFPERMAARVASCRNAWRVLPLAVDAAGAQLI